MRIPLLIAAGPAPAQVESQVEAGSIPGEPIPDASAGAPALTDLSFASLLDAELLHNPVRDWLIALGVLLILLVTIWVLRRVLAVRAEKLAQRSATRWDDLLVAVVRDVRLWLVFPALVSVAARSLILSAAVDKTIQILAVVGVSLQLLLTSRLVIDYMLTMLLKGFRTTRGEPDPTVASSLGVLRVMAFAVIAAIVLLLALDNLGIEITPMLTGLGIGGIAVALAVQNILSDLFGSLTIILDKPFVVGDFIIVGDKMGTVEKIGIKTTRVRALAGEQLVFANNDLLSSRIQNFKRMYQRRVVFGFGVIYETTPEQLLAIPGIVRAAVERHDKTRFDRSHFKSFGAYALDFETVYLVKDPDFNIYMDIQQAINLEILEQFAAAGIEFAYPTQVEVQRVEKRPPPQYLPGPALSDGHAASRAADPAGEPDAAAGGG